VAKLIDHLNDDPSAASIADEPVDYIHTLEPVWEVCDDLSCGQITNRELHIPTRATVAEAIVDATSSHYGSYSRNPAGQKDHISLVFLCCSHENEAHLEVECDVDRTRYSLEGQATAVRVRNVRKRKTVKRRGMWSKMIIMCSVVLG
jgi:hypothetical protein